MPEIEDDPEVEAEIVLEEPEAIELKPEAIKPIDEEKEEMVETLPAPEINLPSNDLPLMPK